MSEHNVARRRGFLRMGIAVAVGGVIGGKLSAAEICNDRTPEQTQGPFYPGDSNIQAINDLTWVPGAPRAALGEVIYIQGVVTDLNCAPVEGASVEIWQACASGRYNHAQDPNSAPLDPHFRYWGETFTNAKGEYSFKTIKPGAYPASEDWDRPPHIHFRIAKLGYSELVTQMYFRGEVLNQEDLILQRVPARLRESVIVDFQSKPEEPTALMGSFNISIEKLV